MTPMLEPTSSTNSRAGSVRLTWLLAVLIATMRVAWIYPWLLAVGAWMAPSYAQPILPLWSLYALLVGGRAAAQIATVRTASLRQARLWMAVLGPLVLLLLLWWLYGRPLPIWDVRWLQLATGSPDLWVQEVAPAVIAFFVAAWLWLRGVLDAGAPVDHESIVGSFVTGSIAFAVLLVGNHLTGAASAAGAPLWLTIFVTAGMAALALASLERSLYAGGAAAVTRLRLNRYWLGSVALVIVAVLLLGFVVSALIAPESLAQAFALLTPVVDVLAQVLLAVVYVAVYALFLVLTPLIEWLRGLIAAQQAQETPTDAAAMQPLSPLFFDQAAAAPAELVEPFRWGVIVAVVIAAALIFALSLRFLRVTEGSDVDETRESILSRSLLAEQLRNLWARLRAQPRADGAEFLSLDGEASTRRLIRARYQAFLAVMAARGQPRPPAATPALYAAQFDDLPPPQQTALHALTSIYTAVRYGGASPTADEVVTDEVDWD